MEATYRSLISKQDGTLTREQDFQGRKHLIVPLIALVEGVLVPGNINKPELALITEFEKSLDQWNGRPIVLNHPRIDGESTSANIPDAYDTHAFGLIFNASVDGKKLKTEAWIDLARAKELGGDFQSVIDRVKSGSMIEVSTGFKTNAVPTNGRYNGVEYEAVWRDIVPDHLAILSSQVGACSIKDGCGGPRINVGALTDPIPDPVLEFETLAQAFGAMTEETLNRLTDLEAVENVLPTPHKGEGSKKFISRCMGDAGMNKEFPDQKQRAAICYRQSRSKKNNSSELLQEHELDATSMSAMDMEPRLNVLAKARRPAFSGKESTSWAGVDKSLSAYIKGYNQHSSGKEDVAANAKDLSTGAKRWIASKSLIGDPGAQNNRDLLFFPCVNPSTNKLNEGALRAVLGGRGAQAGIPATALDSARSMARSLLNSQFGAKLQNNDDGTILGCELTSKERDLFIANQFVLASEGISDGDKRTAINMAIDDEMTSDGSMNSCMAVAVFAKSFVYMDWMQGGYTEVSYTADDQGNISADFMNGVEVRPMTQFVPVNTADTMTENSSIEDNAMADIKVTIDDAVKDQNKPAAQPLSLWDYIKAAPEGVRTILESSVKVYQAHLDSLVQKIVANKKNTFTEAELKDMTEATITKLAALAEADPTPEVKPDPKIEIKADYRGNNGALRLGTGEEPKEVPPPPRIGDVFLASLKEPRKAAVPYNV